MSEEAIQQVKNPCLKPSILKKPKDQIAQPKVERTTIHTLQTSSTTDSQPQSSKMRLDKLKLHPFDFNGEDLAEIKKMFPEFRPKRAVKRSSTKVVGLPIADLKKKLKEKIQLEGKMLQELVEKLDHRNEEKITWSEFLTFLENEGMRREIVNDAQIYGIGVKRLQEGQRVVVKENERVMEYYIDCLCYIQMRQFRFLLALFENNAAKLLDLDDFKVVQELQFQSDYGIPKESTANSLNQTRTNIRAKTPNTIANKTSIYNQLHPFQLDETITKNSAYNQSLLRKDTIFTEYHEQTVDNNDYDSNSESDNINMRLLNQSTILNISKGNVYQEDQQSIQDDTKGKSNGGEYSKRSTSYMNKVKEYSNQEIKNRSTLYSSVERIKTNTSGFQQSFSSATKETRNKISLTNSNKKIIGRHFSRNFKQVNSSLANRKSTVVDTAHYKSAVFDGNQQYDNFLHKPTEKRSFQSATKIHSQKRQQPYHQEASRNYLHTSVTKASTNYPNNAQSSIYGKRSQSSNLAPSYHSRHQFNHQRRAFDSSERRLKLKKQQKKLYGILGLTKIEDEEGSAAYLLGKDLTRERPFGLKDLFPNLHQEYNKNKRRFEQLIVTMDKKINAYQSTMKESQPQFSLEDDESYQMMGMIQKIKGKVVEQKDKLDDLRETNKYFYKQTSSSVHMPIEQQLENNSNRQQQRVSQKEDTIHQKPEMITKYVENLNKKGGVIKQDSKLQSLLGEKKEYNGDNLFEQNRKKKVKSTKEIYSVCANFHEGLGILAISLIDREIKIYKLKQNGQKVTLQDQFSFTAKFLVTCLHIEQYVVNSRPILCMGSAQGDVAIYYIDEPAVNQTTKKKDLDKCRQILHTQFNFFQRGNEKSGYQQENKVYINGMRGVGMQNKSQFQQNNSMNFEHHLDSTFTNFQQHNQIENEITQIRYVREIGLISTAFNGTIKIFDCFDFKELWKTGNKTRKQIYHTNVLCFDVSTSIGLMATGGAEGKLMLIDPYAFGIVNQVQAHTSEIIALYIYDEQYQIITIAQDRTISLWDAYRLEKIQSVKDISVNHTPKFTSATFDKHHGLLFTGCQALKSWEAKVDSQIEIEAIQIETLCRNQQQNEKRIISAFEGSNDEEIGQVVKRTIKHGEQKNGKVLVTNTSELVDIIINESEDINFLITIDSENLVRAWSVKDNQTQFTYKLPMKKRVTAVAIDPTCQYLAVGNCIGEAKILNLKSGGILYNLPNIDEEITCLKFLSGMSEFWLVGGCWQGKLMMWTNPNEDNNFTVTAKCRIGHKDDVLTIDSSSQYIVSGGVDGLVSVWNLFSGILKYAIQLPPPSKIVPDKKDKDNSSSSSDLSDISEDDLNDRDTQNVHNSKVKRRKTLIKQKSFYNEEKVVFETVKPHEKAAIALKKTIVGLCFHPYYPNLVCVMQEGGDIHVIDASNGSIAYEYVAKVKMNSNWACDKENQKLFVVGDVGKAIVFDMAFMESRTKQSLKFNLQKKTLNGSVSNKTKLRLNDGQSIEPNPLKRKTVKDVKWKVLKPWFVAHDIHKMESAFVVTAKYASHIKVFITATSKGEVKLWSNTDDCECLGILNSSNWNPSGIMQSVHKVRKENRLKEKQKDESKMEELRKKIKSNLSNNSLCY